MTFSSGDSQTVEQVAQRGCTVSILVDFQDSAGRRSEQTGLMA